MRGRYRKGQVCILRNTRHHDGYEVTLLSDYSEILNRDTQEYEWAYYVDMVDDDGVSFMALEDQLILKHESGNMSFDELMSELSGENV